MHLHIYSCASHLKGTLRRTHACRHCSFVIGTTGKHVQVHRCAAGGPAHSWQAYYLARRVGVLTNDWFQGAFYKLIPSH